MKSTLLDDNLAAVACEVIETTAFAFAEVSTPEQAPLPDWGVVRAKITFLGPANGAIYLAASEDAALNLAGNLLGLDCQEVSEDQARQGVHELLNIIAGQWLTRTYGVQAVFHLGIPAASDESPAAESTCVHLIVDDYPLCLQLCVDD